MPVLRSCTFSMLPAKLFYFHGTCMCEAHARPLQCRVALCWLAKTQRRHVYLFFMFDARMSSSNTKVRRHQGSIQTNSIPTFVLEISAEFDLEVWLSAKHIVSLLHTFNFDISEAAQASCFSFHMYFATGNDPSCCCVFCVYKRARPKTRC